PPRQVRGDDERRAREPEEPEDGRRRDRLQIDPRPGEVAVPAVRVVRERDARRSPLPSFVDGAHSTNPFVLRSVTLAAFPPKNAWKPQGFFQVTLRKTPLRWVLRSWSSRGRSCGSCARATHSGWGPPSSPRARRR